MTRLTRTIVVIVVGFAALLAPAGRASAQGTGGSLPGPIDSRQMGDYAKRLALSDAQILAIEGEHDEYRRAFRLLREGEIEAFLKEQMAAQGAIPERDHVEGLLLKFERVQARIATLDTMFFDRVLPLLSEEQQQRVPRLRLLRERRRYEAASTALALGRTPVDLSVLFLELELGAEAAAAPDAALATYERQLTSLLRKQNTAIRNMTLDTMDMLAERGYANLSREALMADPKLIQKLVVDMQEIYPIVQGRILELSKEIRALNNRTAAQVGGLLPPASARAFRLAFYRQAYSELAGITSRARDDWMTNALRLDDLTDDERSLLAETGGTLQRELARLLASGIDAIDRYLEAFSPYGGDPAIATNLRAAIQDLKTKAREADERAAERVEPLLGADRIKAIREALARLDAAAPTSARGRPAGAAPAAAGSDADALARRFRFSGDRFLPARISRRDVRRYAKQLQLEPGMSDVLDAVHLDYLERVSGLDVFEELREARHEARVGDDDSAARVGRVEALRRQAIEAMAAADAAFFEDARVIVGEQRSPLLDRVRACRHRQAYLGSANDNLGLGRFTSKEAGVDVVSIVLEQQPPAAVLAAIDDVLADYGEAAMTAFRARLDAQLAVQRKADHWAAEIDRAVDSDVAELIDVQMRYRDAMRGDEARVAETNDAIIAINRRTLADVLAAVPPEPAGAIRRAYDLAAFPSIYEDPASVDGHLAAALDLEDLTAHQRETLRAMASTYPSEYERLSRAMVAQVGSTTVNVIGLDADTFAKWQEQHRRIAKVAFERGELNGRTIRRLAALLSAEQVQRIGGLPEPPGEDEFFLYR